MHTLGVGTVAHAFGALSVPDPPLPDILLKRMANIAMRIITSTDTSAEAAVQIVPVLPPRLILAFAALYKLPRNAGEGNRHK